MKIVVVYESLYGNTKAIAEAVAQGLQAAGEVTAANVDAITPAAATGAHLIVAGGPTHAHGMVRKTSRHPKQTRKVPRELPGTVILSEWIAGLGTSPGLAATFDTRFDKPRWITGAASKKIARLLGRAGRSVIGSESFLVTGTAGPLAEGESERALAWGRRIAAEVRPGERVTAQPVH